MAQDTHPTGDNEGTKPEIVDPAGVEEDDGRIHYYSGGEVTELAQTRVSPVLWIFWSFLIVAAIGYFLFGGAVPAIHRFRVAGGSAANIQNLQSQLQANYGANSQPMVQLTDFERPGNQTVDQAVTAGSDVYQNNCIGCHGPNQDGNGFNAAALNPKPRNLHDAPFMQSMSYQRILTSISKGVPGTAMPRWENTLTKGQIQDVIIYVLSLTDFSKQTGDSAMDPSTVSGGANGSQPSPAPATPPIGGNAAAHTVTSPQPIGGLTAPKPGQAHKLKPSGTAAI